MDPVDPDRIGPDTTPKKSIGQKIVAVPRSIIKSLSTREGLLGDYDYAFLFKPNLPFMKKAERAAPFFGLNEKMPIILALILGFQHALSMLAGIITPPIILAGQGGVNLPEEMAQYLVSTSLIVCGILSSIQITRFHIYKSPYYWNWPDLCCRYFICHHSCCWRRLCSDVRHRLLSERFRGEPPSLPQRIWCPHWHCISLRSARNRPVFLETTVAQKALSSSCHRSHRGFDRHFTCAVRIPGLGRRVWLLFSKAKNWSIPALP